VENFLLLPPGLRDLSEDLLRRLPPDSELEDEPLEDDAEDEELELRRRFLPLGGLSRPIAAGVKKLV